MSTIKTRIIYKKIFYTAFLPALVFCLTACQIQAMQKAELRKQGKNAVQESDLRAFCPPVEFAEGAYAYRLYGKSAKSAGSIVYQAAISDITRDCRYDHEKGLISMQIAAAGRVVIGVGAGGGTLNLPIAVKIARGDHVLFARTYQQKLVLGQADAATQFLFSEKVSVRKAEAVKGTKVTIGFASAGSPAGKQKAGQVAPQQNRQNKEQKARPGTDVDRISPKAGNIIIPESF